MEAGTPDARKCFMLQVLMPYLAAIKQLPDDEVPDVCHRFLENSCRNHGNRVRVDDSWIESVIRSAENREFKGFSLERLK